MAAEHTEREKIRLGVLVFQKNLIKSVGLPSLVRRQAMMRLTTPPALAVQNFWGHECRFKFDFSMKSPR